MMRGYDYTLAVLCSQKKTLQEQERSDADKWKKTKTLTSKIPKVLDSICGELDARRDVGTAGKGQFWQKSHERRGASIAIVSVSF